MYPTLPSHVNVKTFVIGKTAVKTVGLVLSGT